VSLGRTKTKYKLDLFCIPKNNEKLNIKTNNEQKAYYEIVKVFLASSNKHEHFSFTTDRHFFAAVLNTISLAR
jgi:hypothetical protein